MKDSQQKCSPEQEKLIETIYRAEFRGMRNFAYFMTKDYELAEVAVQETFLLALRIPEKLSASPSPVGWMYAALKNITKHVIRDKQTILRRYVAMEDVGEGAAFHTDTYSELDDSILECPDMKLLYTFYVQGYSLKDLSAMSGKSIGACKMQIKRAKERMKKRISRMG